MKINLSKNQEAQKRHSMENLRTEIEKGWSGKTSNRSIKDIISSKKL